MDRKPAYQTATVDFGVPTAITGASISRDGKFTLFGPDGIAVPQNAWRSTQRERPKGEILNRMPVAPDSANLLEGQVLSQFDYVFAIDTNTERIADRMVSVAFVARDLNRRRSPSWRMG